MSLQGWTCCQISWVVPGDFQLGEVKLDDNLCEHHLDFPSCSVVKNPPAMQETQETWVRSLSQKIPWRRKWQLTPVFLPEKSHGQRSLVGYNPKGHKESDVTKWLNTNHHARSILSIKMCGAFRTQPVTRSWRTEHASLPRSFGSSWWERIRVSCSLLLCQKGMPSPFKARLVASMEWLSPHPL